MLKPKLNTLKRVLSGVMAAVMCLGLLPAVNNANALEEVTDTSTLYIQTVDNMTGGALAGVRVKVECTTAGQYKDYGTLTSDVGGRIAINNAPVGFYRVTGVGASEGYRVDTTSTLVHLQKGAGTAPVATVVAYAEHPLIIKKIDALNHRGLPNAEFTVVNSSGNVVAQGVTDSNGYFRVPYIEPGTYTVTEVRAPAGYHPSAPQTVTVLASADGDPFLIFTDSEMNMLSIRKTDKATGMPLANAHFRLETANGTAVAGGNDLITDNDGMAYLSNLPAGNYKLTETQAPTDYILDQPAITFTLTQDTENKMIAVTNSRPGALMVYAKSTKGEALAGTHFELYDKDNKRVGSALATNAEGYVYFDNLEPGTYTVIATRATDGYLLETNTKQVTIRKNQVTTETFVLSKRPRVVIVCENDKGVRMPGATFTMKGPDGKVIGPFVTGADGTATIDNLEAGDYQISQTGAPAGYVITVAAVNRSLTPDHTEQVTFIIKTKPYIEILHYIKGTTTPLAGAKFELWQNNKKIIEGYSGSDGRVVFENVEPGQYTVRHVSTPDGYTIDTPSQNLNVEAVNSGYLQFTSSRNSSILITKVDADTEDPLAGAVFEIRDLQGTVLDRITTTTDGTATSKTLTPGQYIVAEIQPPNGYVRDEDTRIVTVVNDQICAQRFTNRKMSVIVIHAVDQAGAPVRGAQFIVTDLESGRQVDNVITDASGIATTKVLDPSRYLVREINAPAGYIMDTKVIGDVVINTNTATYVTFMHSLQSIIQIRNEDSDGNPIAGSEFKVTNQETGYVVGYFTTDESGLASTSILDSGIYQVVQVTVPDGYSTKTEMYTVAVKDNAASIVRFVNDRKSVLNIKKVDSKTGASLSGVIFTLADETGHVVGRYTTDSTGCVTTQPLTPGTYLLREYKAADGYVIDEACKTNVLIKADEPTYVQMTNTQKPVIQITKEDADTGDLLAGAEFTVEKGGNIVGTFITNLDGLATTGELEPGVYTVYETKAPEGYTLNSTPYTVTVRAGLTTSLNVRDTQNAGLTITKTNESGNPLAGAEFTLYTRNGQKVADLVTQVNGVASVPNLTAGYYILRETKAPDGYKLDSSSRMIMVKSDAGASVKIVNQSLSQIVIKKTDADTGLALSGAVFEITNSTGNVAATLRTDQSGLAQTDSLKDGTYYVKEIIAPTNYMVDTSVRTVELHAGETVNLNITNSIKAGVHIHLNDIVTGDGLDGGRFVIKTIDGVTVGEGKTEAGLLIIPNLPDGNYIVSQVTAPTNYIKETISQNITVISNQTTHVYFLNQPMTGLIIENVVAATHDPLDGGVFEVYDSTGKQVYHGTTDETGRLETGIIEPGKYTIKQMAIKSGYTIITSTQTVTITVNKPTTAVFENRPHTTLLINLVDNETKAAISGADFRVQSVRGEFETRVTTNEAGFASVDNLTPGYYVVTQINTVSGYILKGTYQFAYIRSSVNTELTFTNERFTGLVIENVVLNSHEPLAQGKFEVWALNTENKVFEGTTDNTGILQTNIITPGKYLIRHLATANGYTILTATQVVEVKVNTETHAVFNNVPLGTLEITKIDEKTRDPLAGATFKVVRQNSSFEVSVTTDETGVAHLSDLETGDYVVTETHAPDGYRLNNIAQNVKIRSGETSRLTFANQQLAGIIIEKTDADTGAALAGAEFQISTENGRVLPGRFITDEAGRIETDALTPGRYTIKEMVAPQGYILSDAVQTVTVITGEPTVVPFTNRAMAGITIMKVDAATNAPLKGAQFEIYDRNGITPLGMYTTEEDGTAKTGIMTPGTYIIKEIKAPIGYLIDVASKTVTLKANTPLTVKFTDTAKPSLQIEKLDATDTSKPLAGATFKLYDSKGTYVGDYTTDESGLVFVDDLTPGQYRLTEVKAPIGYVIDSNSRTINIKAATQTKVTVTNKPETGIVITKIDSKTAEPLAGALFEISELNGGIVNTYTTDSSGLLHTEVLKPGKYVVKELRAPEGYMIDDASQIVEVVAGKSTNIRITNTKMSGIEIKKVDADTNEPLQGAVFELCSSLGKKIDELTTDATGYAHTGALEAGEYILKEIKAPENYVIDETSKTIKVVANETSKITFTNRKKAALQIWKMDDATGDMLSGAKFSVQTATGQQVTTVETGKDGIAVVPTLNPGTYLVTETKAPTGYYLDATPQTVTIGTNTPSVLKFYDKPLAALRIQKTDAATGESLSGAVFKIIKENGDYVGEYTTELDGLINIPTMAPGRYIITETKAPEGYIVDNTVRTVEVKTGTPSVVTIENDRTSGIQIRKTVTQTGEPLKGVTFKIKSAEGKLIGNFTTDNAGLIYVSLNPGEYIVQETSTPEGYVLDNKPQYVTVKANEPTVLEITNDKLTTVRIHKVDAETGEGIYGVAFEIKDAKNNYIGSYKTDDQGYIELSSVLPDGRYVITETKAADGYVIDSKPRTVKISSSEPTEIIWENARQKGQVKIIKYAADDNASLNIAAGSRLAGAEFTVTTQNGSVVDTVTTNANGEAFTSALDLGTYLVQETKAPEGYTINSKAAQINVTSTNQQIELEFYDNAMDIGVSIEKQGEAKAVVGNSMKYYLKNIRNTSNVPVDNFFFSDTLPTDAVRAQTLYTGTYSAQVNYKIEYKTNMYDYRALADGLSSKTQYSYDLSSQALNLESNEYVTHIRFVFGTVPAQFHEMVSPVIYAYILPNVANNYQIINRCEVGAQYEGRWITDADTWTTVAVKNEVKLPSKLPTTGF